MSQPRALITGITGQDGAYLAELLISKGYDVHGLRRRSSSFNTGRIDHLYTDPHNPDTRLYLHYGDLADASSLVRVLAEVRPCEVYNLGAQSHVDVSFENPEYTADAAGLGALRLLEAIRVLGLSCRYYQASTSELFGNAPAPQNEQTPFRPRSPYGSAKLYAHATTVNYREAYGMHASNGILFNHESPLRGETFVTRKITRGLARIKHGLQSCLYLGNLDAKRDWGHAKDYVEAQWLMLQQDQPDDYVIATGEQHSVREFVEQVADCMGELLLWRGEGQDEVGFIGNTHATGQAGRVVVRIDPSYYRPAEVHSLLGDASHARHKLGWEPNTSFEVLVQEMAEHDDKLARTEAAG